MPKDVNYKRVSRSMLSQLSKLLQHIDYHPSRNRQNISLQRFFIQTYTLTNYQQYIKPAFRNLLHHVFRVFVATVVVTLSRPIQHWSWRLYVAYHVFSRFVFNSVFELPNSNKCTAFVVAFVTDDQVYRYTLLVDIATGVMRVADAAASSQFVHWFSTVSCG